jgi:D-alanyl-D-alanine carboxypeptidase (penicillin-binding protein 5/6)
MKKPMHRVLRFISLCIVSGVALAAPRPLPDAPSPDAASYVLMDFASGQVLTDKDADKRVEPASITKIMTSYIVFDELKQGRIALDDEVTVSQKAYEMGGSKMFIEVNKKVSVEDLLRGVVVASGNDASVALAEFVAGSEDTFASYMNQYAEELGLTNSHFVNATGWPAENHYMSARDIAHLSHALIEDFPDYYDRYYHEKSFTYNGITQNNRNSLLWTDETVDGIKTGHTESAGFCLAASARREGMRLISVVTGTRSDAARKTANRALLEYGFRFFEPYKFYEDGAAISKMRVYKGSVTEVALKARGDVHVAVPRGQRDELRTTAELPAVLMAPLPADEPVGTLKVSYGDNLLHQEPLYPAHAVEEGGVFRQIADEFMLLFK